MRDNNKIAIEEMAKDICRHYEEGDLCRAYNEAVECDCDCWTGTYLAPKLYDAGYRKQSEGEWIKDNASKFEHRYNCSVCNFRQIGKPTPYCPNCGAKMKGGAK